MADLQDLFVTGRIVDLMLLFLAVEVAALVIVARRTGRRISALSLLINAAAGGSLMLALRTALTGEHWTATAACLLAALVLHATDVAQRFRESRIRT